MRLVETLRYVVFGNICEQTLAESTSKVNIDPFHNSGSCVMMHKSMNLLNTNAGGYLFMQCLPLWNIMNLINLWH